MPRKVWAASSGSYSDYGVDRLFELKEDAEAFVAEGHAEFVESFDLYPAGYRPKTVLLYVASMNGRSGSNVSVEEQLWLDEEDKLADQHRRPQIKGYGSAGDGPYLAFYDQDWWRIEAICIDRAAAIKAATDRAAVLEAKDAGL